MLAKLDLSKLELHRDSHFCSSVLESADHITDIEMTNSQQESRNLLEDFLAKHLTQSASTQERLLEDEINKLFGLLVKEPSKIGQVHRNLLLKLVRNTDISLRSDVVQQMFAFCFETSEYSEQSDFFVQVLNEYLLRVKDVRGAYEASLTYHSQTVRTVTETSCYLRSIQILKVLLARMDAQAFKDVEDVIQKHTCSGSSQSV